MKFKFTLGIDVSKNWFNLCLMTNQYEIIAEEQVDNNPVAIDAFLDDLFSKGYLKDMNDIVMIMEHTGIYVQHLVNAWLAQSGKLTIVPATQVSQLLSGLDHYEEKTDAMDARRLAEYAIRYSDKLKLWQAKKANLKLLQALQRQRTRTKDAVNLLEVPIKESKKFDTKKLHKALKENHAEPLKALKQAIKNIDQQLNELINDDGQLKEFFKLISSVEGVGPVTAREILIATAAFNDFLPNQAKAFAKYCGVVPLQKQSGKVKRRARNSKRANRKIKPLLTMGATALIGTKSELGKYYKRKREEGKPHFSIVNAMRNKMILRIFAVVRNGVMYQKNLNLNLVKP